MNKSVISLFATCSLMATASTTWASSTTLNFNYIATNLYGSAGVLSPVASMTITDLADLGVNGAGNGGVRIQFSADNLNQFSSGAPGTSVFVSSFELNFPGTSTANGYNFNNDHWTYVSGVNLAPVTSGGLSGGIEWQEDGATNGWGAAAGDPAFGQEYNYTAGTMVQGSSTTIDLYNAVGFSGISVANLLDPANYVVNATTPSQPQALGWVKLRGTGNANSALRGIASNGYWGASETGGNPVQNRVNVLAVAPSPVPIPAAAPLFLTALASLSFFRRGGKPSKSAA